MQKQKLRLDELQVESFVTSQEKNTTGGVNTTETIGSIITTFLTPVATVVSIASPAVCAGVPGPQPSNNNGPCGIFTNGGNECPTFDGNFSCDLGYQCGDSRDRCW